MKHSLATLGFVAAVGAGALLMARTPTTLEGDVIAMTLLDQLESKGITQMRCEDSVIGREGATFLCHVLASDGSSATIEYSMGRNGQISGKQVSGAP